MLSLQYEVVDPRLLNRLFADLTVLSVRGRKYGVFLLAVMQTDYSSQDMKVTQKMFRFRAAAAVDVTAARAAGFMNTELIKQNFQQGVPGQFVIEYPSFSDIVLAPTYDVKGLLASKTGAQEALIPRSEPEQLPPLRIVNSPRTMAEPSVNGSVNASERAREAYEEDVRRLRGMGWGKQAMIEKVWNVRKGGSPRYKEAEAMYEAIIDRLNGQEPHG